MQQSHSHASSPSTPSTHGVVSKGWRDRRVSVIMKDGKRRTAEARIEERLRKLRHQGVTDPVALVTSALEAVMPSVETVSVKRGGASYQVPHPLSPSRARSLAVRWVVEGARIRVSKSKGKKGAQGIASALASEFMAIDADMKTVMKSGEASKNVVSHAMNKKVARHRTAKANRVFAHLRWR